MGFRVQPGASHSVVGRKELDRVQGLSHELLVRTLLAESLVHTDTGQGALDTWKE